MHSAAAMTNSVRIPPLKRVMLLGTPRHAPPNAGAIDDSNTIEMLHMTTISSHGAPHVETMIGNRPPTGNENTATPTIEQRARSATDGGDDDDRPVAKPADAKAKRNEHAHTLPNSTAALTVITQCESRAMPRIPSSVQYPDHEYIRDRQTHERGGAIHFFFPFLTGGRMNRLRLSSASREVVLRFLDGSLRATKSSSGWTLHLSASGTNAAITSSPSG